MQRRSRQSRCASISSLRFCPSTQSIKPLSGFLALLLRGCLRYASSCTRTSQWPCLVLLQTRQTAIKKHDNRFLTDLEHAIDDVFERLVVLEASIRYTKLDGEAVYIPVTTIIERDGETVTASRTYGDMAPLYDVDPDEAPLIC